MTVSTSAFVPAGAPDQARSGDALSPSHVYCRGMAPPSSKAVLVRVNDSGLMVGTSEAEGLAAWGDSRLGANNGEPLDGLPTGVDGPLTGELAGADEQALKAKAKAMATSANPSVVRTSPIIDHASRLASRSVSSRYPAAARAERVRPVGPPRNTTRWTWRSPAGVAMAIETAGSPPRGLILTATPTSAPPNSPARFA